MQHIVMYNDITTSYNYDIIKIRYLKENFRQCDISHIRLHILRILKNSMLIYVII